MDTLKKETLKAAGVDVENALERFMGKEDFLERMLKKFAADTNYAKLAEAVGKKDPESALQASHTLKGMCGNLSITSLIPLFTRQVELLRAEEYRRNILGIPHGLPNIVPPSLDAAPPHGRIVPIISVAVEKRLQTKLF